MSVSNVTVTINGRVLADSVRSFHASRGRAEPLSPTELISRARWHEAQARRIRRLLKSQD